MSVLPVLDLSRQHSTLLARAYAAVVDWAVGLSAHAVREIRLRRDMRKLAELDDRMLRDIGLARGQIEPAARHGRRSLGLRPVESGSDPCG